MATAAAAAAAYMAFSSFHLSSSVFMRPSLSCRNLRTIPPIRCSISSPSGEFNISFGSGRKEAPKDKLVSEDAAKQDHSFQQPPSHPLFIPWIVRDENGNLTLQMTPPARFLHAMADAKTTSTGVKKKKKPTKAVAPTPGPKHSKAARRFYNENFRDPPQRLSKVLAAAGVSSRRSSEELIFEGRVTVNGSVCNTPQTRVDPARDVIYVNGSRLAKKLPPKVYFALNKPKGYICSFGEKESKSVILLFDDFLKNWNKRNPGLPKPRLFTVGRLDVATTGLIIVTNDGDFAQRLSHPSSKLSKEYIATIDGSVNKRHLIAVTKGTVIEGIQCTPDSVELLPQQPDMSRPRLRIVVHEGRNHEVREIIKNAGLMLHSLKRVRIGGFRLPSDLGLGKHVELEQSDLKSLGGKI
ncbi:putative ribosomal large subunit pseudouridine synthase SVR1, chloroplastic isoform X1 [Telopea speciosissima]|uniref:putative ribosomal large subunit pseudouridine synthase SVR1, chloroplastic isoform X1 n=2 Tax=Telopea speciosissima TaxID=54955 RepID=UPI001CC455AE|nr:putative ribosomal large subunit pseudouridine synthase SVR1, chloroplastic isoform X1 [Telopea speciosissima]